jgi:hypothetical protein
MIITLSNNRNLAGDFKQTNPTFHIRENLISLVGWGLAYNRMGYAFHKAWPLNKENIF